MNVQARPDAETAHADTLDQILARSAARFGDRLALRFGERSWSYSELDQAVSAASVALTARGLRPGDRVAAYGVNSDAYLIGFLACARAGLVHVPVNYALRSAELAYILDDSGSTAVLVDPDLRSHLDGVASHVKHVILLRDDVASLLELVKAGGDHGQVVPPGRSGPDTIQLLYTSGTTSRPKGAIMSHRALMHEYVSCMLALDMAETDNPLVCMPLYHAAGMHVFMLPYLAVGATVTLLERPDIPEILRTIEADGIGSLFLAPTVWVPLSSHPDLDIRDLTSLGKAQYGASIMPTTVLERLRRRFPQIGFYNCFGQSEIGPLATVLRPEEHENRPESCGQAVHYVELRVVDPEGQDVPAGQPGEVVYRSPQLCDGYWRNPEATSEAFTGGWFHSGDLVVRDAQGYITVVDRIKDVINTGGVLVAPREVEDALYTHPAVAEAAVVAMPDERWIEAVTAVVVLADTATRPASEELIEHVKKRIAGYKVPKRVVVVDELPRNQSGKLLKRVIRESLGETLVEISEHATHVGG